MALDRKKIRLALRDALSDRMGNSGIKEFRTKDILESDALPRRLPILVVTSDGEQVDSSERARPPIWHLRYQVWVHLYVDPKEEDPDSARDLVVAALEAALERQDGEDSNSWYTTLGGICSRAYVAGEIVYHGEGVTSPIISAMVPVEVVVPTPSRGLPAPS
jgi:hypothetical protein